MNFLQEAITADLPFLREQAESRMTSRVTIHHRLAEQTRDKVTGKQSPSWVESHADLPFRLDGSSTGDGGTRSVDIDGVTYETATGVGHFPAATLNLTDGDLIEITVGESVGTVWRIVKAVRADQKTARRMPIVEDQRPSEWGA